MKMYMYNCIHTCAHVNICEALKGHRPSLYTPNSEIPISLN